VIEAVAQELGGQSKVLALANPEERLDGCESLRIKMVYERAESLVRAEPQTPSSTALAFVRVRGGFAQIGHAPRSSR